MNKVKVLIQGYAKKIESGWLASSTVTLVQSSGKKIIVDPGCNRKKLLEELANNGLKSGDIDFVLLTHNHTDHTLLAGVFVNAKVLTTDEIYDSDNQIEHHNKIPGTDLEIIQSWVILQNTARWSCLLLRGLMLFVAMCFGGWIVKNRK
jgi:glyoxylase-like metal-dependent hydrolase (beta-lactamase superfamily II)